MKKEVILAIIIGISIGAIITFGIHTARTALQNQDDATDIADETEFTTTPSASSHLLTINSPRPDQIIADNDTDITGITSPESFISAISDTNQAVAIADEQGNFSIILTLEPGANPITVKSFHPDGQEASQEIIIVHSDTDLESITQTEDNADNEDESEESDPEADNE